MNANEYDLKRFPSYTDRILFDQTSLYIVNTLYNSVEELDISDHKPIYGLFDAKIKVIDFNKRA